MNVRKNNNIIAIMNNMLKREETGVKENEDNAVMGGKDRVNCSFQDQEGMTWPWKAER